ncbi:hypothetical protein [uncultured Roseobacter sp.]|uniref:hypothetical protein n=1 Tax=uncultured Roseobacter sp. TaxID=114847 RepID=UPI00261D8308|nr:hypothetical protein [uncultured Roseobacter sp.]
MDRLINMILRQITRRLVNKGIDAGFKKAASMNKKRGETSEQSLQSKQQIKQAAKMMRRTTRM